MSIGRFAERLIQARQTGIAAGWRDVPLPDRAASYAVQDAVAATLGRITDWKVGAPDTTAEPTCAPCPSAGVFDTGSALVGPDRHLRGVEVEIGLRLGRALVGTPSRSDCIRAVDAILPVIEVVETRLADWQDSTPLAKLADFQSHGGLVIGQPSVMPPALLDLREIGAELTFDDRVAASTHGGNPAGDIWRLLAWLAGQAEARGRPLQAGAIITTGSCTGMLFADAGMRVRGQIAGVGEIEVQF